MGTKHGSRILDTIKNSPEKFSNLTYLQLYQKGADNVQLFIL